MEGSVCIGICGICGDTNFGGGKSYENCLNASSLCSRYQDLKLTLTSGGGFSAFNLLLLRVRLVDIDSSGRGVGGQDVRPMPSIYWQRSKPRFFSRGCHPHRPSLSSYRLKRRIICLCSQSSRVDSRRYFFTIPVLLPYFIRISPFFFLLELFLLRFLCLQMSLACQCLSEGPAVGTALSIRS